MPHHAHDAMTDAEAAAAPDPGPAAPVPPPAAKDGSSEDREFLTWWAAGTAASALGWGLALLAAAALLRHFHP